MSDQAANTIDESAEASGNPWSDRLWWVVVAAVAVIAAWDITKAMATPGGIGEGIGEAFPLLIPLGFAFWGKRIGSLGFSILAVAVIVVEVAVMRLELLFL